MITRNFTIETEFVAGDKSASTGNCGSFSDESAAWDEANRIATALGGTVIQEDISQIPEYSQDAFKSKVVLKLAINVPMATSSCVESFIIARVWCSKTLASQAQVNAEFGSAT